jgi:hypothetical protein
MAMLHKVQVVELRHELGSPRGRFLITTWYFLCIPIYKITEQQTYIGPR